MSDIVDNATPSLYTYTSAHIIYVNKFRYVIWLIDRRSVTTCDLKIPKN